MLILVAMALFERPKIRRPPLPGSDSSKEDAGWVKTPAAVILDDEVPADVVEAQSVVQPGELSSPEASAGLGRHLGFFSTTFLMYVTTSEFFRAMR